MITRQRFHNMVRSLFNIEGFQIEGLTRREQECFTRDPIAFFFRCEDRAKDAIFAAVLKRQDFSNDYEDNANDNG